MDSTYEESSAETEVSWEEFFDLQNQTLKEIIILLARAYGSQSS